MRDRASHNTIFISLISQTIYIVLCKTIMCQYGVRTFDLALNHFLFNFDSLEKWTRRSIAEGRLRNSCFSRLWP